MARRGIGVALAMLALAAVATIATGPAAAGGKKAKVTVGNNFFSPKSKTVKKGTKVKFRWDGGGAPHNVTKRRGPGGKVVSETTSDAGVNFRKKFKQKGTYRFICTIHPDSMKLKLRVK